MSDKPVCLDDFEKFAAKTLTKNAYDYYRSGADDQVSLDDNKNAFKRWLIRPRFLVDVSNVQMDTTILGNRIDFPVCIAPTAMQRMAHPEGEVATAKAAAEMNTCMTLSTISTSSIEEVAEGAGPGLRWFQLYVYKDREVTKNLIRRAEKSGFNALVLTVDAPIFAKRRDDVRNEFSLPPHLKMANFDVSAFTDVKSKFDTSGINKYVASLFDPSLNWNDVKWLKGFTKLPVLVKGILTDHDAVKALECGVDGIIVSNHGARQLDTVPATIDALPEVVKAVNGRCEVFLDGGIRNGTDVLKAIALGARAVFIGRPVVYGLAYNGAEGVKMVLDLIKSETMTAFALAGCPSIHKIPPNLLVKQDFYLSKL